MQKWLGCGLLAGLMLAFVVSAQAEETRVGGYFKLQLFDYVDGQHNGTPGTQYSGFSLAEVYVYFYHELSNMFAIDLQPSFRASTGATPALGKNIGAQRPRDSRGNLTDAAFGFAGFERAVLKASLPYDVEVSGGVLLPQFTWDYGAQYFWDEEMNGSRFSTSLFLGELRATGLEIYKNFEFSTFSLPTTFYVLNNLLTSYANVDNNRHPSVLLRITPEYGWLKLSGSYGIGTWDERDAYLAQRYALGLSTTYADFTLRAEYAGGLWEKEVFDPATGRTRDSKPFGYYAKLIYRAFPWLKVTAAGSLADHDFNGYFFAGPGPGEKYLSFSVTTAFYLTGTSMLMLQFERDDWRVKDDSDVLKFNRVTTGVRSNF